MPRMSLPFSQPSCELPTSIARTFSNDSSSKKNDEISCLSASCSSSSSIAATLQKRRENPTSPSMATHNTLSCTDFRTLGKVRVLHHVFAVFHFILFGSAVWGAVLALNMCPREVFIACLVTAMASAIRLLWMLGSAISQAAVASTMLAAPVSSSIDPVVGDKMVPSMRQKRRMWYVRWLWWGRFGAFVTVLQLVGAAYLTFSFVKYSSIASNHCYSADNLGKWHRGFFFALALVAWLLTSMQCCIGPDILAWSSLYARQSDAWRAYYHEMFDYGIREALCCLGRAQYITGDEDEVDSVAAVLGDLVSYRAAGASHLEFLAGLALLQLQGPSVPSSIERLPAPASLIKEAAILHPYAVAAYTGPLLDVGRNPLIFPCVWLHRQGVLTPWNRNRRPKLEGDNWWRGHATAFLRHSKLPPEALRQGRVHQAKRESAYFVTVVHELRSVVVAVRGTETPEDLLTDGLGRESLLTDSDLCGLLQSEKLSKTMMQRLLSTKPHFAHEGIIEAARELALQLDNLSEDSRDSSSSDFHGLGISIENPVDSEKKGGILSTLLGPGGECEGYALRFVGHSLGGSVAALAALRLYGRYPQLHVYGYGIMPCVDESVADACSSFVTSIVYNDEFSSRLSVSAIKRLRLAAIKALASESSSDSGTITRLARRLLGSQQPVSALPNDGREFTKEVTVASRLNKHKGKRFKCRLRGGIYLCSHACSCMMYLSNHSSSRSPNFQLSDLSQSSAHSSKVVQRGLHERGIQAQCNVESFAFTRDCEDLVSGSSLSVDDQISDTENVCLDAGRDGDNDEESEVLIVGDDVERPRCLHIKPKEEGDQHITTNGDICHTFENINKGKAPLYCDSTSNALTNHTVCTGLFEEDDQHEMFMPGIIVHVVPVSKSSNWQSWDLWGRKLQQGCQHHAFIKDRRNFQDLVISPSMFLDHMPWRCQYALNHVLEHDNEAVDDPTNSLV